MPRRYNRGFKLEAVRMTSEPGMTAGDVERRRGMRTGVVCD